MTGSGLREAAGLGSRPRQGTLDRTDDRRVHRVRQAQTARNRSKRVAGKTRARPGGVKALAGRAEASRQMPRGEGVTLR